MKRKAIENGQKARELMHENSTLKEEIKKLTEWSDGAKRLLDNYVKLMFDKDDRSYKMEQEFKKTKLELESLKKSLCNNCHKDLEQKTNG